jgi:hypothetical protein
MRFRPANIRVINRRRSFSIGYSLCPHRGFPTELCNKQSAVRPFSFLRHSLRTVLAVKGSFHRANPARP